MQPSIGRFSLAWRASPTRTITSLAELTEGAASLADCVCVLDRWICRRSDPPCSRGTSVCSSGFLANLEPLNDANVLTSFATHWLIHRIDLFIFNSQSQALLGGIQTRSANLAVTHLFFSSLALVVSVQAISFYYVTLLCFIHLPFFSLRVQLGRKLVQNPWLSKSSPKKTLRHVWVVLTDFWSLTNSFVSPLMHQQISDSLTVSKPTDCPTEEKETNLTSYKLILFQGWTTWTSNFPHNGSLWSSVLIQVGFCFAHWHVFWNVFMVYLLCSYWAPLLTRRLCHISFPGSPCGAKREKRLNNARQKISHTHLLLLGQSTK